MLTVLHRLADVATGADGVGLVVAASTNRDVECETQRNSSGDRAESSLRKNVRKIICEREHTSVACEWLVDSM